MLGGWWMTCWCGAWTPCWCDGRYGCYFLALYHAQMLLQVIFWLAWFSTNSTLDNLYNLEIYFKSHDSCSLHKTIILEQHCGPNNGPQTTKFQKTTFNIKMSPKMQMKLKMTKHDIKKENNLKNEDDFTFRYFPKIRNMLCGVSWDILTNNYHFKHTQSP